VNSAGVRALIVEDDQSWQQILSEILTDTGLTVDVAENLETAVALLRATHYRLAVVDLALDSSDHHNQDGLRVLDAARRHDPGCVPVLLTGFATPPRVGQPGLGRLIGLQPFPQGRVFPSWVWSEEQCAANLDKPHALVYAVDTNDTTNSNTFLMGFTWFS
jgi:CheY-like chemotaxis protein